MLIFTKLSKRNDELAAPSNGIFIYVMPLGTMDRSSLRDSSAKESDAPSSSHQLTVTHLALGRSALTVENVKKLQQEYEAAGRFTTKESVQDFLCKQAQILTPPEILCHNIGAGYAALGAKVSDGISSSVGATEDDESVASLETILVNNAETDKKVTSTVGRLPSNKSSTGSVIPTTSSCSCSICSRRKVNRSPNPTSSIEKAICITNGNREKKQMRRNSPLVQTGQHTPLCDVPLIMEVPYPQYVSSSSTGPVGNVMSKKRIFATTTQPKEVIDNTRRPTISQNPGSAMHRNQTMDSVFVVLQQMHADFEKLIMKQADQHSKSFVH